MTPPWRGCQSALMTRLGVGPALAVFAGLAAVMDSSRSEKTRREVRILLLFSGVRMEPRPRNKKNSLTFFAHGLC
jgi:hypothetical protein